MTTEPQDALLRRLVIVPRQGLWNRLSIVRDFGHVFHPQCVPPLCTKRDIQFIDLKERSVFTIG
jgi:hypothetical protein